MIHFSFTLSYFQIYIISISFLSFILYTYDKLQALKTSKNTRRVPEIRLLFTTLLGGTLGSLLAMFVFRHKIKKASFIIKFILVVIVQAGIAFLYMRGII